MAKGVVKKVSDFNVDIYDNGFTLRYTGEDDNDSWAEVKVIVATVDELCEHIKEISNLPRE